MAGLQDFRQKYPQYNAVADDVLADRLYQKHYAGKIDRGDFDRRMGLAQAAPEPVAPEAPQPSRLRAVGMETEQPAPAAGIGSIVPDVSHMVAPSPVPLMASPEVPSAPAFAPDTGSETWGSLGGKLVENIPAMARQVGGGAVRAMGEADLPATTGFGLNPFDPTLQEANVVQQGRSAAPGGIADTGREIFAAASADLQANAPDVDPESLKGYAYDMGQALVQMVPTIAVGMATKNPNLALTLMGGQVYAQKYGEARESGRTPEEASADAAFYALAETIPEKIPLEILMKPGSRFLPRVLKSAGAEGIQEMFTEALQSAYDVGVVGEEMTWGEALNQMKRAGIIGVGVGGGLAVGTHGADVLMRGRPSPEGAPIPGDMPIMTSEGVAPPRDREEPQILPEGAVPAETIIPAPVEEEAPVPNVTRPDLEAVLNDERALAEIAAEREAAENWTPSKDWQPVPTGAAVDPTLEVRDVDGKQQARIAPAAGTKAAPVAIETKADVTAGAEATQSPTAAQAEAGNYRKRHVKIAGLDVTIETEVGRERSGIDPDGKPWSVKMPAPYGYIKRSKGADGDQVDVYLGPDPQAQTVYVIDQVDADTNAYDEHKVMIGMPDEATARAVYEAAFSDGRGADRMGAVTPMTQQQFRTWLARADTTKPVATALPKPELTDAQRSELGGFVANTKVALDPIRLAKRLNADPEAVRRALVRMAGRSIRLTKAGKFARVPVQSAPRDIFQFLADMGGIKDDRGELMAMDLNRTFLPGRGKLMRPGGLSLDYAREAAEEAGYIRPREINVTTSIDDLLDALRRQAAGDKVYSVEDLSEVADREVARQAEEDKARYAEDEAAVRAVMAETGLSLSDASVMEAAAMVQQGVDPLDAVSDIAERDAIENQREFVEDAREEGLGDEWAIPFDGGTEIGAGEGPAAPVSVPAQVDAGAAPERAPQREEPRTPEQGRAEGVAPQPGADFAAQFRILDRNDPDAWDDLRIALAEKYPERTAEIVDAQDAAGGRPQERPESNEEKSERRRKYGEQARAIVAALERGGSFVVAGARHRIINRPDAVEVRGNTLHISGLKRDSALPEANYEFYLEEANRTARPATERPTPAIERTDAGEQAVIPGAERISDKALAERRMEQPRRAAREQKPADEGLFDTGARGQADLVDMAKQPKKADDDTPMFSLSQPRNLFVAHNIKPDGVLNAAKVGGLPMPSLAIARADKDGFSNFGEITLLASPDMIDPKRDRSARVHDADAYSPRYPTVKHEINDARFSDVNKEIVASVKEIGGSARDGLEISTIEDRGPAEMRHKDALKYQFIKDAGIPFEIAKKPDGTPDFYENGRRIREALDGREGDYADYAAEKLKGVVKRERIFKGFTYSGNRRYVEHTLDNALKDMKSRLKEGENWNYGAASIRSKHSRRFTSLKKIQEARDRIVTEEEMDAAKKEFNDRLMAVIEELRPYYRFDGNSFSYAEDASSMLGEMASKGPRALAEGFDGIPEETMQEVRAFIADLAAAPTSYFEVNMVRNVALSEFKAAVIPVGTRKSVRQALEDAGLAIIEYDKAVAGSREDAIRNAENTIGEQIMFSIAPPTESSAFKKWFGDSKVVDENGKPLVVYHGTAADFDVFSEEAPAQHIDMPGFYFTPDPKKASRFAKTAEEPVLDGDGYFVGMSGGNVMPVYLSLQNPAVIDMNKDTRNGFVPAYEVERLLNEARAKGHDGAIIRGWQDKSGPTQYVSFDETRIKSIFNRGTFDPADPRISFKLDGTPTRPTASDMERAEQAAIEIHTPFTGAFLDKASAVYPALRKELDRLGLKSTNLRLADRIEYWVNGEAGTADGMFLKNAVTLSLDTSRDMAETLNHEALHALRRAGAFTEAEWNLLSKKSNDTWRAQYKIGETYDGFPEWAQIEEGVAHAYGEWRAGRLKPDGRIVRLFRRISEIMEAIRNAFQGQGFTTAEQVFRRVESGEVGGRQTTTTAPESPMFAITEQGEEPKLNIQPETAQERKDAMQGFISRGQPIDRAFRIPFQIFGGVDKGGRWKPGMALFDGASKILTDAKFSEKGRFAFVNPVMETARRGLVDRYGLSDAYVARERERALDERKIMMEGAEVLKTLKDHAVGIEEARVLQAVLTGEAVADADMAKLAEPIRKAVDNLGQEAVALGLLSPEAFERNRGSYLNRVYKKNEVDQDGLTKFVTNTMGRQRKKIIGNQFRGRGLFMDVPTGRLMKDIPDFVEGARGAPEKGEKFRVLDEYSETGELDIGEGKKPTPIRRIYWPADVAVPKKYADFKDNGVWEVRGEKGKGVVLWRDFTKPEREKMGEILDARYTIGKTFMLMSHDLATGRFYRDVAQNEDWARTDVPSEGWMDAAEWSRTGGRFIKKAGIEWIKVPTTTIPGSGGTQRWGAISGMYVREEIWRDINEMEIMSTPGVWRTLLTTWKLNKTARSPVVHMNNVMSNFVFMDMADIRMQDLASGIRAYAKGEESADYREAVENAAFGGDMMTQEIRKNVMQPILDEIEAADAAMMDAPASRMKTLGHIASKIFGYAKFADEKMVDAYRVEDEIFRMATYMRRRSLGDTPKQAADFARQQFIDYDIRAPWVNMARNTVLPFLSYTYRAAPLVARAMAYHPWKLPKYFLIAYMANMLGYMATGDDDDVTEDRERRSLRDTEQGYAWIGAPRMLRMPFKDKYENPIFLDIRRWIPAGDIFDTQGNDIPAWLNLSGPLLLGAELFLNRSSFTGDDIVNTEVDDFWERSGKRGDYLWKAWMPSAAWVPGSWYWQKIGNAVKGATDYQGRPYDIGLATLSSVGIKLKPQDVEDAMSWKAFEFSKTERAIKDEARRLQKQRSRGMVSEKAFNERMRVLTDKMGALNQKRTETLQSEPANP